MIAEEEQCIGPQRSRAFPNDIELELYFPRRIQTIEQKVIYTLWREGAQSYSNLRLLTGVPEQDLDEVLERLQREGRISAGQFRRAGRSQDRWEYTVFALVPKKVSCF